jgi:pre-mRNA-splicing helicase BRR2
LRRNLLLYPPTGADQDFDMETLKVAEGEDSDDDDDSDDAMEE